MINQLTVLRKENLKIGIPDLKTRLNMLDAIASWLVKHEEQIYQALHNDLGKSEFESYETEIMPLLKEIKFYKRNLKTLMKDRKVTTPFFLFKAQSRIKRKPYGQVLILAPWNYPLQLSLLPLITALASGNSVVLKPSEISSHTSELIVSMFLELDLDPYVCVITGDAAVSQKLLEYPFDKIFFTGSSKVGSLVMAAAAKNLTPVTLELGGKSPAIVDQNSNMNLYAKRIVWGKYINAGQTCIAPDYVLVHENQVDDFVAACVASIENSVLKNLDDYPKIINHQHIERLESYLEGQEVIYGPDREGDKIMPHLVLNPSLDSKLMQEEIFGPILPILTYTKIEEVYAIVNSLPKPLALYIFSEDKAFQEEIMSRIDAGGICINDTLVHFANSKLPFGGVGQSGMGSYHGEHGYNCFTRQQAILKRSSKVELNLRYPPYKDQLKFLKFFSK